MFDVLYYPDNDLYDQPSPGDWDRYELFINPKEHELEVGDKVITVSYNNEGWSEIKLSDYHSKWPHEVPKRFWQRVIIGIFSKK